MINLISILIGGGILFENGQGLLLDQIRYSILDGLLKQQINYRRKNPMDIFLNEKGGRSR